MCRLVWWSFIYCLRRAINVFLNLFTWPSVCGWHSVIGIKFVSAAAHNKANNFDKNCGPLFVMIVSNTPYGVIQTFIITTALIGAAIFSTWSACDILLCRSTITVMSLFSFDIDKFHWSTGWKQLQSSLMSFWQPLSSIVLAFKQELESIRGLVVQIVYSSETILHFFAPRCPTSFGQFVW